MKKFLVILGAFCAFAIGYGAVTVAYPAGGVDGRSQWHGYFNNALDDKGTYVLPMDYEGGTRAIPNSVNSASEFINFIKYTKLDLDGNGSGNAQEKTSAAFIIHTMIGTPAGQRNRPPTAAQIAEWEQRVNYASSQGWISWSTTYTYTVNSYYQGPKGGGSPNDDAFYDESGSSNVAIVFRDGTGKVVYALRRQCANPVGTGNLGPIPKADNFDMDATTTVSDTTVLPGQAIVFRNYVKNLGPGAAPSVKWIAHNPITGANIATGGPNAYTNGQVRLVYTENYTVPAGMPAGTQICRTTWATPNTEAGGTDISPAACAVVQYDFGLIPNVTAVINGGATTGGFAEVGDQVQFVYTVRNTGLTQSQTTNCTIYGQNTNGYRATPATPDTSSSPGYAPPATGCPRVFPYNSNTTLVTETINPVTAAQNNKTLCRSLTVTPAEESGASRSAIGCVTIANKPYMRVYGGDISAGNGFTNAGSCAQNSNAAIVGWNKEAAGAYAGAGAQFAELALNTIYDHATGLGNNSGTNGSRLAFANTAVTGGKFGGGFGSLPCIADYASKMPAGTPSLPGGPTVNLSSLTGQHAYKANGPITISGNINPGQRTSLFVNGDVIIGAGGVSYTGSWGVTDMPLFQVVATGNIYIDHNATQLDGLYVAQRTGSSGGTIYTCATGQVPTDKNTLAGQCGNKLTINGAFVAYQVQFLRGGGTLRQSNATETAASGQAGEVFNYSPLMWMVTPPGQATPGTYDSLTSLPPIL